ncbi:MAG: polynucleotide adenylyltransferase, partial [Oscillospiraceae bacterium]|nr:polynucleotide adenylyltransferase [Oscillospiraceae bacterium]
YYGHAQKSAEIAETVLRRLKADSETIKTVSELVRRHEDRFEPSKKAVKRLLGKTSPEFYEKLLSLMEADESGKRAEFRLGESVFEEFRRLAAEIVEKEECFSLKNLAVSGADLISAGFEPGPEMGKILENLLEKVIEGEIPNEKEKLLSFVKNEFKM